MAPHPAGELKLVQTGSCPFVHYLLPLNKAQLAAVSFFRGGGASKGGFRVSFTFVHFQPCIVDTGVGSKCFQPGERFTSVMMSAGK